MPGTGLGQGGTGRGVGVAVGGGTGICNKVCCLAWQNIPCGVPSDCKSLLLSVCYNDWPIMFALDLFISNSTSTHLVWLQLSVCYNDMLWYASTHLVWLQLSVCYNDMLWYASTHLVWLPRHYQWCRKPRTDKQSIMFWTITATVTLSKDRSNTIFP